MVCAFSCNSNSLVSKVFLKFSKRDLSRASFGALSRSEKENSAFPEQHQSLGLFEGDFGSNCSHEDLGTVIGCACDFEIGLTASGLSSSSIGLGVGGLSRVTSLISQPLSLVYSSFASAIEVSRFMSFCDH
eukprot:snap_masked-scaffold_7-processed-gene-10.32-mRNA-1 protein AED:1.00 eAED:1.00 QI:0/-1/0/0/-1/1/1/0/130